MIITPCIFQFSHTVSKKSRMLNIPITQWHHPHAGSFMISTSIIEEIIFWLLILVFPRSERMVLLTANSHIYKALKMLSKSAFRYAIKNNSLFLCVALLKYFLLLRNLWFSKLYVSNWIDLSHSLVYQSILSLWWGLSALLRFLYISPKAWHQELDMVMLGDRCSYLRHPFSNQG